MENFAHILSPENKVSSMVDRSVAGTREIAQDRPVFTGRAPNADAQLFQEPSAVRAQAPETKVSGDPDVNTSGYPETKVSVHPEAKSSGHSGAKVSGDPDVNTSGYPETKVSVHPEAKPSGHSGAKVSGEPDANTSARLMSKVTTHPDTEVSERPSRRKYSAKYKLQILNEIDSSARTGEIGAILRREGLYASTVASWRSQKERGQLEGLSPKKRGPKSNGPDERDKQIKELELQNRKLQRKLARAHLLLDIQKKISEITGIPLSETEDEEDD